MRGSGRARAVLAVLVVAVACACAPIGPVAAPAPGIPGCDLTDEFAFVGETTLAAIGLGGDFSGPEANRRGLVQVTADPVSMFPGPRVLPPPGEDPLEPLSRMVCVQWPDGSSMAGPVPADWQPPDVPLEETTGGEDGMPGVPTALLVLAAIAILIGVSFLAFRERRTA